MRVTARVVAAAWISIAASAAAEAEAISLDRICPADASGMHRFNSTALMMAALDAKQPSRRTLDSNGDGDESEAERLSVILLNPCAVAGSSCNDDSGKIVAVQSALLETFSRTDVTITRRRGPPTSAEIRAEPWLEIKPEEGAVGSIAELLDPVGRFLAVDCHLPTQDEAKPSPATGAASIAPRRTPAIRITSKLEELTREAGQDIKTVDAATLSVAKDNAGKKLTYAIDGILGIDLPLGDAGNTLIPFVQYQRTSERDRSSIPAKTSRSPDKLGLGAMVSLRVAKHDIINIAPIYIVDYEKSSRLFSIKANWIPGFLRDIHGIPVMRSFPLIPDLMYWGIAPRVLLQGSHVFEAGSNTELLKNSSYLRAGGDISLDLWGGGALRDFTGSVAYKRLFRFDGGPKDVDLLKADLQYWLDSGQHVSVGYTYEHGLDEDTTEGVDDWKLSLGVRF